MNEPKLTDVAGIGPAKVIALNDAGIHTVGDLVNAPFEDVTAIRGFSTVKGKQVRAMARMLWNRWLKYIEDQELVDAGSVETEAIAAEVVDTEDVADAVLEPFVESPDDESVTSWDLIDPLERLSGDAHKKKDKKSKTKNKKKEKDKMKKDKDKKSKKKDKEVKKSKKKGKDKKAKDKKKDKKKGKKKGKKKSKKK